MARKNYEHLNEPKRKKYKKIIKKKRTIGTHTKPTAKLNNKREDEKMDNIDNHKNWKNFISRRLSEKEKEM